MEKMMIDAATGGAIDITIQTAAILTADEVERKRVQSTAITKVRRTECEAPAGASSTAPPAESAATHRVALDTEVAERVEQRQRETCRQEWEELVAESYAGLVGEAHARDGKREEQRLYDAWASTALILTAP